MNILTLNTLNGDKVIVKGGNGGNSGGGSGGSGSVSSWKYYDLTSASSQPAPLLIGMFQMVKVESGGYNVIVPSGAAVLFPTIPQVKAMALETTLKIADEGTLELITLGEYLDKYNVISGMMPEGATEITEEEFYNLNA